MAKKAQPTPSAKVPVKATKAVSKVAKTVKGSKNAKKHPYPT